MVSFSLPVMLHLWQNAFSAFGEEFPGRNLKSSQNILCSAPPNKSTSPPTAPQRKNGDHEPHLSALWHGQLFKDRENRTRVLRPNSLINIKEVASSGATREEEIQLVP